MQYKVIVMDVDGTLFNRDKKICPKTKEKLIAVQNMGVRLILASGRPTSGLMDIAKSLKMDKHHGLLVSYNGSKVVDAENQEVLFNEPLTVNEAKEVLKHLHNFPRVRAMVDKDDYMYVENVYDCFVNFNNKAFNVYEYESRGGKYKLCEVDDLAEFVNYELNKILTTGDPEYLKEHYLAMKKPFEDKLSCMFTGPFYFEFTAKGIDKAKALDFVLSKMGYIKEELLAFGDGHNDISMIEYAGRGVAMANAVDDLKAIADEITLSNNDDGIAHTLDKYF